MPTLTPTIVNLTATVTAAPTASSLQASGCFVSVGGTTLTTNTYQFCSSVAAVTAILSSTGNYTELSHMASTFFAQSSAAGGPVGVYILEIGAQSGVVTTQITALGTWITNNPLVFYAFLTPAAWDTSNSTNTNTMAAAFSSATGRTYFFVTTSSTNLTNYTNKAI
jgi:hypothetical protein